MNHHRHLWRLQGHHQTHPDGGGPETSGAEIRDIFEKAVEGIFQTTPEALPQCQPTLARIYGYPTPEALLDRHIQKLSSILTPRHLQRIMKEHGEIHEFESFSSMEENLDQRDRSNRDEAGNILYYEGLVEDISERKRAEAAMEFARDAAMESIASSRSSPA